MAHHAQYERQIRDVSDWLTSSMDKIKHISTELSSVAGLENSCKEIEVHDSYYSPPLVIN